MKRAADFLLGTCRLTVRTPWPEQVLAALSRSKLLFWDMRREGDLLSFRIYRRSLPRTKALLQAQGCPVEAQARSGLSWRLRGLRSRWALLLGLAVCICLMVQLQTRVWYFDVSGNERLDDEQILQALEQIGIGFGTSQRLLDEQFIRNRMLLLLPELEWCSVNKRGLHGEVLVKERDPKPEIPDHALVSNLVAARAGVIVRMDVYRGYPVTEVGRSVLPGELLVSGVGTGFDEILCCRAKGEIYALTQHESEWILPEKSRVRRAAGKKTVRWSLVIGKKRLNFFEDSSISLTGYDKIEQNYSCVLPGGISFPIRLVKTVCTAYASAPAPTDEDTALTVLRAAEEDALARSLIAGTVLSKEEALTREGGVYRYRARTDCREMIARTQEINPFTE